MSWRGSYGFNNGREGGRYIYKQLSPDRGCLLALCPFESRTVGIGPQLGIIIPGATIQTYLNFKVYWDSTHRIGLLA
jgi:hypothetical protein